MALRRCRVCGTTRFSATVIPDAIYADGYHDGSSDFGYDYGGGAGYEDAVADLRLDWLESRVTKGSIVDVGGGLGYFAARAAQRGWEATLVEPVPAAVRHASERFGLRALEMGVEDLAASGETFDLVTLNHAVEHFPEALETLRKLKPAVGGHLFVEVPNLASLGRRLMGDKWLGWQAGEHVYVFTRRTLCSLLERAGYDVIDSGTFVPGWHGLIPDSYAHLLGVENLLNRVVAIRRALTRKAGMRAPDPAGPVGNNAPITESLGVRHTLFTKGFDLLATAEARTGLGTNVRVLCRPRA